MTRMDSSDTRPSDVITLRDIRELVKRSSHAGGVATKFREVVERIVQMSELENRIVAIAATGEAGGGQLSASIRRGVETDKLTEALSKLYIEFRLADDSEAARSLIRQLEQPNKVKDEGARRR